MLGENTPTENWGGNPLQDYDIREQDYVNETGQGVGDTINLIGLDAAWALWHNLWADLRFLYRYKQSDEPGRNRDT